MGFPVDKRPVGLAGAVASAAVLLTHDTAFGVLGYSVVIITHVIWAIQGLC